MALAHHLLKAYSRGRSRLLLPPSPRQTPFEYRIHVFFSSSSRGACSGHTELYTAPFSRSLCDYCRPELGLGSGLGLGLGSGLALVSGLHRSELGLGFASGARFLSTDGGCDETKGNRGEEEDGGELDEDAAEEHGDEELDEDGDGDGEDDLQLVSETQSALPDFKDPAEEAAYIGYKVIGHIKAGDVGQFKAPKAFAVVQVGSHQFKISPGDCIYTEKLKFADVNDKLSLEKVLLLGSRSQTVIGRPFIPKAFVHAVVEEQVLDAKVIIFKKKRRKNYRRTAGHRQELTRLRILDIRGLGEARSAIA